MNDTPEMHFRDVYGHSMCCAEWGVSASWCVRFFSILRYLDSLTKNFTGSFD